MSLKSRCLACAGEVRVQARDTQLEAPVAAVTLGQSAAGKYLQLATVICWHARDHLNTGFKGSWPLICPSRHKGFGEEG